MLPNVIIELGNGNLGRVASSDDGVAGMVLTGVLEGDFPLNKVILLHSTTDLDKLKITAEKNPLLVESVKEFYAGAVDGATLYVMLVPATMTLKAMCDGVTSPAGKLIEAANGKIRLVAINKQPDASYKPVVEKCLDKDAIDCVMAMQKLAEDYQGKVMPFRALVPAYGWSGEVTAIYAPNEAASPNVGMVISTTATGNCAVARILGRAARVSVATSVARVADGALTDEAFFENGTKWEEHSSVAGVLHEAGYLLYRRFPTRNGYFVNLDQMAAPVTNDYSRLNIGRVVDKASVIAYSTYLNFVNDTLPVGDDGKILSGTVKYIENVIEDNVLNTMRGEISGVKAEVDRSVDVIATGLLAVELSITPLATINTIKVLLKMSNPSNS